MVGRPMPRMCYPSGFSRGSTTPSCRFPASIPSRIPADSVGERRCIPPHRIECWRRPAALPDLELGIRVVFAFSAQAETLPIAWSVGSGALPDGIELDSVSGDLLGIPSRTGDFDFVIRARDADSRL